MSALNGFILRVLLWLPVCFGAWYFLSILFTAPLASLVDALMTWLFPALIERVEQVGNALSVITRIQVSAPSGGGEATGDLLFDLNPLKYGYCVPLYTALVLATPAEDGAKILRWVIGMSILLAVQVFGIGTEILKILAFDIGGEQARELMGFSAWGYEGLALAYQLGFLILPSVVPIMTWFGQFQDALPEMVASQPSSQAPK